MLPPSSIIFGSYHFHVLSLSSYASPQSHASAVLEVEVDKVEDFDQSLAAAIQSLWNDGGLKQCYDRRNEYQLSDSTK